MTGIDRLRDPRRAGALTCCRDLLAALAAAWLLMNAPAMADVAAEPAADDAALRAGTLRFQQCLLCHGTQANGNPGTGAPALAGLDRWYVQAQLLAYRAGTRGGHPQNTNGRAMQAVAAGLSDEDIADAARFLTSLPWSPRPPLVSGNVDRGEALYQSCAVCHGPTARGNQTLDAPSLTQQRDWYLAAQLHAFRSGVRGSHPDLPYGATMQAAARALGEDDAAVDDVVAYIASLPPLAAPLAPSPGR